MELHEADEAYSIIVHYDTVKEVQVRLTVNTFKGVEYLNLRRYYLDFNEEWLPTPEGVAMPLDMDNSRALFKGLLEIISLAESKDLLEQEFGDIIKDLYVK